MSVPYVNYVGVNARVAVFARLKEYWSRADVDSGSLSVTYKASYVL